MYSEKDILDLVERTLEAHQPTDYRLTVDRSGVTHNGNWWHIAVVPSEPDASAYDYNRIMAAVEDEIEQANDVKLLLVPTIVD